MSHGSVSGASQRGTRHCRRTGKRKQDQSRTHMSGRMSCCRSTAPSPDRSRSCRRTHRGPGLHVAAPRTSAASPEPLWISDTDCGSRWQHSAVKQRAGIQMLHVHRHGSEVPQREPRRRQCRGRPERTCALRLLRLRVGGQRPTADAAGAARHGVGVAARVAARDVRARRACDAAHVVKGSIVTPNSKRSVSLEAPQA